LPGAKGLIGFISPVSSHFCPRCNRLRLTADGKMRPCLFSQEEDDVRRLLRGGGSDREILRAIRDCLARKPRDHGGLASFTDRSMSQIGG